MIWPPQQMTSLINVLGTSTGKADIDATADRLAWTGMAHEAFNIKTISFRLQNFTTGNTASMSIYTIGTDGRPTATLWSANGTGASPTGTVAVADGWNTITLTNQAELVAGDAFAIAFEHSSGSVPSYGMSTSFSKDVNGGDSSLYPVLWTDLTGGAAYVGANNQLPYMWVAASSVADDVIALPFLRGWNAGTTPSISGTLERGMKFIAPMAARVTGIRFAKVNIAAGRTLTISLWDATDSPGADPTPLAQNTLDTDAFFNTTSDGYVDVFFTSPYTLVAGTTYFVGIMGDGTTGELFELPCDGVTNAIRTCGAGVGNTAHVANRTWTGIVPGAWTLSTSTFANVHLIIDQIDDGAGTGGGALLMSRGNLNGGFA